MRECQSKRTVLSMKSCLHDKPQSIKLEAARTNQVCSADLATRPADFLMRGARQMW
jgi:hypothetical protein